MSKVHTMFYYLKLLPWFPGWLFQIPTSSRSYLEQLLINLMNLGPRNELCPMFSPKTWLVAATCWTHDVENRQGHKRHQPHADLPGSIVKFFNLQSLLIRLDTQLEMINTWFYLFFHSTPGCPSDEMTVQMTSDSWGAQPGWLQETGNEGTFAQRST